MTARLCLLVLVVAAAACGRTTRVTTTTTASPADSRMGEGEQEAVWVCHGNKKKEWKKIPEPALSGHEKHGDRVSRRPQEEGKACT